MFASPDAWMNCSPSTTLAGILADSFIAPPSALSLQHFAVTLNHVVRQACRCLCERALWEGRGSFQVHRFIERVDWFNFTASRCETNNEPGAPKRHRAKERKRYQPKG